MTRGAGHVEHPADAEWITQDQAALLTGAPLSSIDWWARSGRFRTRPRDQGPTVHRESLQEFLAAHRASQEQRAARKAAREAAAKAHRAASPRGPGWISTAEAADLLGVTRGHVPELAAAAGLTLGHRGRLLMLRREEVVALASDRADWISHKEARDLTGLSDRAIAAGVAAGRIRTRASARPGQPTLLRSSVEAWAVAEREQRDRVRAEREAAQLARRARNGPPRDGNAWMSVYSASVLVGLTPGRVVQLIAAERLPATRRGGRWWLQATHVRLAVAAREARARSRTAESVRPGAG